MVRKVAYAQLSKIPPEALATYNADFDRWLRAISMHDTVTIFELYSKYHVPAGGIIERLTARMIGLA